MSDAVLYSFRRCPYAMRARMALLISEVAFEIREVKLSAKPAAMIAVSPKGTVPVLLLPNGQVIDESLDIMRWALQQHDPEDWLDGELSSLIEANDGPFKYHLDRYKYPERHETDPKQHSAAALDMLAPLEERLSGQAYICGAQRSFTDAALMPFVRQFAAVDQSWFDAQPLPALKDWLARQLRSPLFEQVMARQRFWQPGEG